MKFHTLFDTPAGKRQLAAMYLPLHTLSLNTDPLTAMAVWRDHRQERYLEPGLEGPNGTTYHLSDTAAYLVSAAQILTNTFAPVVSSRPRDLPREALHILAKAKGYRYERGVRGLRDALKAAGVSLKSSAGFDAKRGEFNDGIEAHMTAAFIVNERGECPAAVANVIRMFVAEVLDLCLWLEQAGFCGHADLITNQMHKAGSILDMQSTPTHPKKRKKSQWV